MAYRPTLLRPVPIADAPRPVPIADAPRPAAEAAAAAPSEAVVPGGLDHSRSPRRFAAEDQPFPDTDIGLSAELSRIIDDHAAMEERTAELESELQARYRDELSRAEAEHVQQIRQEMQMHQRQA